MERKTWGKAAAVSAMLLLFVATGCGSVRHKLELESTYQPKADTTIEVGTVTNETGNTYDIAIDAMFKDSLVGALRNEELLRTETKTVGLTSNCKILDYEKGNAFKRWLWPGWGSTVLFVHCDLMDANSKAGALDARRTVDFGGAYTIGAWEKVFDEVAWDVVQDMREKIRGK
ncbi:MAG: DUF4410 domain-containing protein [Nitrospiraceae bacterium]|nr:DUF4410 domain-containing protein [Nitrospiraceae bacterium]